MTHELNHQFPQVVNLLLCWYHQGAWFEFETDVQIWSAAFEGMGESDIRPLLAEIETLISLGPVASHEYIQKYADALYVDDPVKSLVWLEALQNWLNTKASTQQS